MNLFKAMAGFFIKSKLSKEKNQLANKLQKELASSNSDFIRGRNTAYLDLLDGANKTLVRKINENI